MWNSIIRFFRNIFAPVPAEQPVEDAAQLLESDMVVVSSEPASSEDLARRRAAGERSRGGLADVIAETVEATPGGANAGIVISQPRFYWLLDNGHGQLQAGKRSPLFPDGTRFEEWEFTRDIVARMIPQLEKAGVQYLNVVPETQVGSFLRERVDRANAAKHPLGLSSIFVSIHSNAFGLGDKWETSETARGIETWHFPGSNSGIRLASIFQRKMMEAFPSWRDRGIKSHQRGSRNVFFVLQNTTMPSVLTECGFYTNLEETEMLRRSDIRQMFADAHVAAILHIEQNGWESETPYRPSMVLA